MDAVERISGRMRWLLIAQAIGFFCWQAGDGLAHSDQIAALVANPAELISLIGAVLWLISMLAFFAQAHKAQRDGLHDILNDEWAQHVRGRAAETAFWALCIGVVGSMTATNFGLDAQMLLKINVGVAVSSFFLAYVWHDSRHEGEA